MMINVPFAVDFN